MFINDKLLFWKLKSVEKMYLSLQLFLGYIIKRKLIIVSNVLHNFNYIKSCIMHSEYVEDSNTVLILMFDLNEHMYLFFIINL